MHANPYLSEWMTLIVDNQAKYNDIVLDRLTAIEGNLGLEPQAEDLALPVTSEASFDMLVDKLENAPSRSRLVSACIIVPT